jgi:hypothetical protein
MGQLQLSLPFTHNETYLREYFQKITGKPLSLTITDNATSMISVKEKKDTISVRLHRIFFSADDDVLNEITCFIKRKKGATSKLRKFINSHKDSLPEPKPKQIKIKPGGRYFNLSEIFDSLNREYFNNSLSPLITWGKRSPRYAVKKRTLGSYQSSTNTIRINPVLDNKKIPRYVMKFIVYHEMLHADIDTELKNGRRRIHSNEFKKREKMYKYYERAVEWERQNFRA